MEDERIVFRREFELALQSAGQLGGPAGSADASEGSVGA